jgi:hypothetical protein
MRSRNSIILLNDVTTTTTKTTSINVLKQHKNIALWQISSFCYILLCHLFEGRRSVYIYFSLRIGVIDLITDGTDSKMWFRYF